MMMHVELVIDYDDGSHERISTPLYHHIPEMGREEFIKAAERAVEVGGKGILFYIERFSPPWIPPETLETVDGKTEKVVSSCFKGEKK